MKAMERRLSVYSMEGRRTLDAVKLDKRVVRSFGVEVVEQGYSNPSETDVWTMTMLHFLNLLTGYGGKALDDRRPIFGSATWRCLRCFWPGIRHCVIRSRQHKGRLKKCWTLWESENTNRFGSSQNLHWG